MKRFTLLLACLLGLLLLNGCNTVAGLGEGISKDSKATWRALVEFGEWFEENTW